KGRGRQGPPVRSGRKENGPTRGAGPHPLHVRAVEVLVALRRRGAALSAVPRAVLRRAVGVLRRRGQLEEAQLTNLHARPQVDGKRRGVRQLKRHIALETRVDEASRGVGQEPKAPQRGLAFETSRHIVGQGDRLKGGAKN